jgi:methionyl aminopeptidase
MINSNVLEKYRLAGRIAAEALIYGTKLVDDNIPLLELAEKIENFIIKKGARPAFPINLGIDNVSAHFTPNSKDKSLLRKGSVLKIDVGVHIDGYLADTAITLEVGTNSYYELIAASREALSIALELIKPGLELRILGSCIEQTIKSKGFKPVKNLTGHTMDRYKLHAGKSIPNVATGIKAKINSGEVLAIEPFASNGSGKVVESFSGNIYRLISTKEPKNRNCKILAEYIKENFASLPFAERWCSRIENHTTLLKELVKEGIIVTYPILVEEENSVVTQAEHTVVVTEDCCEILTFP